MPVFVLFYTRNTRYMNEAMDCRSSLKKFKLDYAIYSVPNRGDWTKNTQLKADVLFLAHKDITGPFVYVDADARIQQPPVLFDTYKDIDFACHYKDGHELLSGTMYFGNTPKSAELVDRWLVYNKKNPTTWDQRTLAMAVKDMPELKTAILPPQYCLIFDSMKKHGNPVIEHFQASRRLKEDVKRRHHV